MTTREQIDHIKAHQAEFDAHQLEENADVERYFHDYSHIPDLYENLCNDLEIEPLPDALQITVHVHKTEEAFYDAIGIPRPDYLPPREDE